VVVSPKKRGGIQSWTIPLH